MRKTNKVLIAASFLLTFSEGLFGPIYAIFVKRIGGGVLDAGFAFGLFWILSGIFVFTLGRMRFFKENLRGMVSLGFVFMTFGAAGYLLVNSATGLFIVEIILGIGEGLLEPAWDGLFSADLDEQTAAASWSFWAGGKNILLGLSAFAGSALVATYSFTALFVVMTVMDLTAAVLSLILVSECLPFEFPQ